MIRKNDIRVPDGYFENLETRLSAIAHAPSQAPRTGLVHRLTPYAAIAASMLLAVTVGNWLLSRTAVIDTQSEYESMLIAEVLRSTDPDGVFLYDEPAEELTDEDIVNYLISTDISLEQINSIRYEDFR